MTERLKKFNAAMRPYAGWLLAAYLLVPPLFKGSLQPFVPIDLTVLLAVPATSVGIAWLAEHYRDLARPVRAALAAWLFLLALVIGGVGWAPDTFVGLRTAAYFTALAGLPLLAALPVGADARALRTFLASFIAVGAGLTVLAFGTLPLAERGTLDMLEASRIQVARALLFVPLVGLPLMAWPHGGWRRWAVVIIAACGLYVSVGTGSRAPSLAFAVVGAALAIGAFAWSRHRGRVVALSTGMVVASVLVTVVLFTMLPSAATARFGLLADALDHPETPAPAATGSARPMTSPVASPAMGADGPAANGTDSDPEPLRGSIAHRVALYRLSWEVFLEHPVIGSGTGGFEVIADRDERLAIHAYPHNLLLHLASDFGLIGLLAIGAFGAVSLVAWRPRGPMDVALAALVLFLLINAMFSNGIYENRMLWGTWLVLLASAQQVSTGEPNRRIPPDAAQA